jgi:hypothetical protein
MSSSKAKTAPKTAPKAKPKTASKAKPASAADPQSELEAAATAALAAADRILGAGETAKVSDEAVQKLLTAGARLYANKLELEDRYFGPFVSAESVTATDVVMNVCEFLRAADLNIFDLAMWFRRPRPGGGD